ncbi:plasminogen receptor (KT)-like, partial [Limulus polyphemus]|uniref:Plasminogen receptor (KT)-like n=1 Tax=Limulus polyphemus TaxID=6850 RepID=A0ABM1BW31_LIMPO
MERQIHMQNIMREKMMAMQIARARELFYWFGSFYLISCAGMLLGFKKTRKPLTLVPFLPLTFIVGYQADMAYGTKLHRIKGEAENILQHESHLVSLPLGIPGLTAIEGARLHHSKEESLQKAHEVFL